MIVSVCEIVYDIDFVNVCQFEMRRETRDEPNGS